MLDIKICLVIGRVVERLLHAISVVRMNSPEYQLQGGFNRSIILKDLVGFLRPVDFPAENTPAETAGVAYVLPFSHERFAALQLRIYFGVPHSTPALHSQHSRSFTP